MNLRFFGTRALLLGGTCDLAISLAELLIAEGLYPILTCRSEEGKQHVANSLQDRTGQYETAHLDLAEPGSIDSLFIQIGNGLDYLVDFAQGDFESLIGSANPESIDRYFSENISFRAEILRMAARNMLQKKRGRLIYVSSAAASRPNPGQGFYAAAKLASEALYRNLGIELANRGITTVTLRPGYVAAGRGAKYIQANEDVSGRVPLGRVLTCEEVAETIVFFLSDNAGGFNATEICMDGGLTAGK
jgi:3-oxoacyl-[acyl-carrier protein] reductase